jgi:hypothetical protein
MLAKDLAEDLAGVTAIRATKRDASASVITGLAIAGV